MEKQAPATSWDKIIAAIETHTGSTPRQTDIHVTPTPERAAITGVWAGHGYCANFVIYSDGSHELTITKVNAIHTERKPAPPPQEHLQSVVRELLEISGMCPRMLAYLFQTSAQTFIHWSHGQPIPTRHHARLITLRNELRGLGATSPARTKRAFINANNGDSLYTKFATQTTQNHPNQPA